MLPTSAGVEPATSCSSDGASNWATEAGDHQEYILHQNESGVMTKNEVNCLLKEL